DPAKASPGQQLLEYLVRDLCEHETETFDFGPGPSMQKLRWGMTPHPLFHTWHAFTLGAHPANWVARGRTTVMRMVKNNDRLFDIFTRTRAKMAGK
ncbi:MAG: hypothetical protein ACR2O4_15495, partial [Hyphomicrobiaceae bacterium]